MINKKWKYSLLDVIKIAFVSSPILSSMIILQAVVSAVVPSLQVLLTGKFIDEVVKIVSEKSSVWNAFIVVIEIVLLIAYQWTIASMMKLVWIKLENKLRESFSVDIVEKRAGLKYFYVENEEIWNLIERVSDQPESRICGAFRTMVSSFCLVSKIAGIVCIIAAYVWWAALLIVVVSVPMFYLSMKSGEAAYEVNQNVTKYKRTFEYLGNVLMGRDAVQERTVFDYASYVDEKWDEQYGFATEMVLEGYRKWYTKLELGSIFTAIISAVVIVVLVVPAIQGAISIGMFISLVNACFSLVNSMSWEMRNYIDTLAQHRAFLKELKAYVQLEEKEGATKEKKDNMKFSSLEFRKVSFKYPGSNRYILNNMSFHIKEGVHYALVGKNGEGKTTIIKLLTGAYEDYEGEILINGIELRKYAFEELKGFYSVVYQDFARYAISLKDNITLGNKKAGDEIISQTVNLFSLNNVIENMPMGINNPLGKVSAASVDISGGEWQRIALARAHVNTAPIHLMDEPTAALDPILECEIYNNFQKLSKSRTTIIISHRLASVKLADEILVIDSGNVVETGSHEELMEMKGLYFEMFNSQRGWYL